MRAAKVGKQPQGRIGSRDAYFLNKFPLAELCENRSKTFDASKLCVPSPYKRSLLLVSPTVLVHPVMASVKHHYWAAYVLKHANADGRCSRPPGDHVLIFLSFMACHNLQTECCWGWMDTWHYVGHYSGNKCSRGPQGPLCLWWPAVNSSLVQRTK